MTNAMRGGFLRDVATDALIVMGPQQQTRASKLANVETAVSPFGFDQVSVPSQPQADGGTSTVERVTDVFYEGTASLHCRLTHAGAGTGIGYARGVFNLPSDTTDAIREGDEFWFAAGVRLGAGYYANKATSSDLLRLDSYVQNDGSTETNQQHLALECFSDDTWHVVANDRSRTSIDLVGTIQPSVISEGRFHWIELHVIASATDGNALTELYVDGLLYGASDLANMFSARAIWNRARAGIVSTSAGETGSFEVWVDRVHFGSRRRPPAATRLPVAAGHEIQSVTAAMPQRRALKLAGTAVRSITDDSTNDVTTASIEGDACATLPTGALMQSLRLVEAEDAITLDGSGELQLALIGLLVPGVTYSGIAFLSASSDVTGLTHRWGALLRVSDDAVLAISADDTSATWSRNTLQRFNFAVPYVPTQYEWARGGLNLTGSTGPVRGRNGSATVHALNPMLQGANGSTGLTTPASLGASTSRPAASGVVPYCFLF